MGAGASAQAHDHQHHGADGSGSYKWQQDQSLKGPWSFLFKEKVQCACEGSRWCTRENPTKMKGPPAIPGLHAHWVGPHVLAMARPWKENVEKHNLVQRFQQEDIGMILNLQEVGEHAHCGPGNLATSGFTYDPEPFMAAKIGMYNFSWRDMGVPSLDRMMDIVQVMDHVVRVEKRKVAVHCHAGLGRTGLSIACYLVASGAHGSDDAIKEVRKYRPGSLQTSRQVQFVSIFEQYVKYLRCVFRSKPPAAEPKKRGGAKKSSIPPQRPSMPGSGDLLEAKESGGVRHEKYRSGLHVVAPLKTQAEAEDTVTDADLGLTQALPWNSDFHIVPQHARDFLPTPPHTYDEALARQARLLHGEPRRAFKSLHQFVKEAIFYIIHEACEAQAALSSPGGGNMTPAARTGQPSTSGRKAEAAAEEAAKSVAHALAVVIGHHSPKNVDSQVLDLLVHVPALKGLVGKDVEPPYVLGQLSSLMQAINAGDYSPLASAHDSAAGSNAGGAAGGRNTAPLAGMEPWPHPSGAAAAAAASGGASGSKPSVLVVMMALETFFGNFEKPPLTQSSLEHIAKVYEDLFDEHKQPGQEVAHMAPSHTSQPGLDPAAHALDILEVLPAPDQELLLVATALLRLVAGASGPGCEHAMVVVGHWLVRLLLGKVANLSQAEEAMMSFLWWLAGQDIPYAVLLMLKKHRNTRQRRKPSISVASLPLPGQVPDSPGPSHGGAPPEQQQQQQPHQQQHPPQHTPEELAWMAQQQAVAAAAAQEAERQRLFQAQEAAVAAALAQYPEGSAPPPPPPAYTQYPAAYFGYPSGVQEPEALARDLNDAYRSTFRAALAGISTVTYPPPASGNMDVHDVWK